METIVSRKPITDALATWLEAALGRPVGKLQSPPNRPFPYYVLYAVPGGSFSGPPLALPNADAELVYQVNSVALSDDAEARADAARAVILGREPDGAFTHPAPAVPGWKIVQREPDGGPAGTEYSGAPPKRVFTVAERYVVAVTPIPE